MECIRCKKEVDVSIPKINAENYGNNIWACPNCGKAYHFYRTVCVNPIETSAKEDDWGNPIVRSNTKYKEE